MKQATKEWLVSKSDVLWTAVDKEPAITPPESVVVMKTISELVVNGSDAPIIAVIKDSAI